MSLISLNLVALRPVNADTDHVREFAKNSTPILIIVSGPQAEPVGRRLEQAIERNGDFKNRNRSDVQVVGTADAERALTTKQFSRCSIVFLLAGSDPASSALSPLLIGLLPFKPDTIGGRLTIVRSGKDGADPGSPEFRVGLYAPDGERLQRIYDVFVQHKATNFRALPFIEAYRTNRLLVYSAPEFQPLFSGGWGRFTDPYVWNDVQWLPLDSQQTPAPSGVPEGTRLYFLDRSHPGPVPPSVTAALSAQPVGPLTLLAIHLNSTSNAPRPPSLGSAQAIGIDDTYVISSPSSALLATRIRNHASVVSLSRLPVTQEAVDLRRAAATSVLIPTSGTPIGENQSAAICDFLVSDAKDLLKIPVEPRGASLDQRAQEVELDRLAGGQSAGANPARGRFRTRFTWVFRLTDLSGTTQYAPTARSLTPDMPVNFSVDEPQEPKRKNRNESDDDFARRHADWQGQHDLWSRQRDDYRSRYLNEPCEWELSVVKQEHAHAHGTLQLWDFEGAGGARPVWQQECDAETNAESVFRKGRTIVVGHQGKPRPMDAPPQSATCAEALSTAAARSAAQYGLNGFTEVALLPGDSMIAAVPTVNPRASGGEVAAAVTSPPQAPPGNNASPAMPPQFAGKVADIDGQTITLTIGGADGVHVGDYFNVALKTREIRDPDTGEVKDIRVTDGILIKVTQVGATADCVLANASESARFPLIQVGLFVAKARRPLTP